MCGPRDIASFSKSSDWKPMVRLLTCLSTASGMVPIALAGTEPLELHTTPFFHGRIRSHQWTGVHVYIRNPSQSDFNLTVEARLESSDREGVHFQSRLPMPRGGQKRLTLHLLPESRYAGIAIACQDEPSRVIAKETKTVQALDDNALHVAHLRRLAQGIGDAMLLRERSVVSNLAENNGTLEVTLAPEPEDAAHIVSLLINDGFEILTNSPLETRPKHAFMQKAKGEVS